MTTDPTPEPLSDDELGSIRRYVALLHPDASARFPLHRLLATVDARDRTIAELREERDRARRDRDGAYQLLIEVRGHVLGDPESDFFAQWLSQTVNDPEAIPLATKAKLDALRRKLDAAAAAARMSVVEPELDDDGS